MYCQPKKILPLKTINERIQKGQRKVLSLTYFNKKSIQSQYEIMSSNIELLAPLDKMVTIEGFKEIEVKLVCKGERVQSQVVYLFFVETKETVNDVYSFSIEVY